MVSHTDHQTISLFDSRLSTNSNFLAKRSLADGLHAVMERAGQYDGCYLRRTIYLGLTWWAIKDCP